MLDMQHLQPDAFVRCVPANVGSHFSTTRLLFAFACVRRGWERNNSDCG